MNLKNIQIFLANKSILLGHTALIVSIGLVTEGTNLVADAAISQGILINFQPQSSAIPTAYLKDTGAAYSANRGYGWVREDSLSSANQIALDISPNTRDRGKSIDPRQNTLIHMQYLTNNPNPTAVKIPAAWEYTIPNGTYQVSVCVGDEINASGVYDSQHTINVEGVNAINRFQSNSKQEYKTATVSVNVTDGRLTVNAIGGTNTKLNYIEIYNAPPLGQITYTLPVIDDESVYLKRSDPDYNLNLNTSKGGLFTGVDGAISDSPARFYIKFPIPTFVLGTKVVSAKLIGYYNDDYDPNDDDYHGIYYVGSDSWTESTITWNNQPGQFFGISEAGFNAATATVGSFISWDVTPIVNQVYEGDPDRLISFLFHASRESTTSTNRNWEYFVEKDYDPSKAFRIELTVAPE